jgi:hypothetical protein
MMVATEIAPKNEQGLTNPGDRSSAVTIFAITRACLDVTIVRRLARGIFGELRPHFPAPDSPPQFKVLSRS